MLCIIRLRGLSIWGVQMTDRRNLFGGDENSFYRLMNNSSMDWRRLLMSFAKQFSAIVQAKGDNGNSIKCFIIDDTDIEKTGKKMERIGRVFNHVTHKCILVFQQFNYET